MLSCISFHSLQTWKYTRLLNCSKQKITKERKVYGLSLAWNGLEKVKTEEKFKE